MNDEDPFLDSYEDFSDDEDITVFYQRIIKETPKAILFLLSPGNTELWLPKSMIDLHTANASLPSQKRFTVPEWFFEKCMAEHKQKQATKQKFSSGFDELDEDA